MSFRTIEISDPRFECEGLRLVTVKSSNLGHRADISVYIPAGNIPSDVAVVILLHGVYGSHWAWSLKAGAHKTLQRMVEAGEIPPFILAMPSDGLWGDGSGYLCRGEVDYEAWITEDVPSAIRETVPKTTEKSPIFIAGLSMGGYGALRLGIKYPNIFQAASGHSSITRYEEMAAFVEEDIRLFAPAITEDHSVLETIKGRRDQLIPFRFDCGTEDPLLEGNRQLHQELTKLEVEHIYEEFPGGHEWTYWEKHLERTLRFFGEMNQR